MKLRSFAFAAVVMFFAQQQSCQQGLQIKGKADVENVIQTNLLPMLEEYFPEARWLQNTNGSMQIIVIDTGVTGVTEKFLTALEPALQQKLQVIQQNRQSLSGIIGQALRVFPEQVWFIFNDSQCTYLPTMRLIYMIPQNATGSGLFDLEKTKCVNEVEDPAAPALQQPETDELRDKPPEEQR